MCLLCNYYYNIHVVQSCLNLIDSLLVKEYGFDLKDSASHIDRLVDLYFVFAYIWSFGGNLHDKSVAGFDHFAREKISKLGPIFPAEGNVYVWLYLCKYF